ncbi:kinase-like domain-containing protein [Talaromyces proteolyticus]|uniref:Kinase-like domain-containing protein n=1 Tax=Talaromyces proteolyticus TaxID=1131652 RepID=A0AAD4KZF7_9EURO|nr:kinase-like domain-containing protein [Talaromyces proteolyticus]KAH8700931.1 kinase-like domain-containing protein [Talaromyces proteolyticus]
MNTHYYPFDPEMMPQVDSFSENEDRQHLLGHKSSQTLPGSITKTNQPSPILKKKATRGQNNKNSTERYIRLADGGHRHCLYHSTSDGHDSIICYDGIVISRTERWKDPDMHFPFMSTFRWLDRVAHKYHSNKEKPKSTRDDSTNCVSPSLLSEKYIYHGDILYSNSSSKVRLIQKRGAKCEINTTENGNKNLYAVKIFTRQGRQQSTKRYLRNLTAEFCISHSLHHPNVVETLDLLQTTTAGNEFCQVMEFCEGGNLFCLLKKVTKLEDDGEADCFFKQLLHGVDYLHSVGVTHRNLKPENLLLTRNGVLKISDFGCAECFKLPWQKAKVTSQEDTDQNLNAYLGGVLGTVPYIAPEVFTDKRFDPMAVDMWSVGIIYFAMRTGRWPWRIAHEGDGLYHKYAKSYGSEERSVIELVLGGSEARQNTICAMLHTKPKSRLTASQALQTDWMRGVSVCEGYSQSAPL